MKFDAFGNRCRNNGRMPLNGKQVNTPDSKRFKEFNFVGMQKILASKYGLAKFSHYDPITKRCKLCYEDVIPSGSIARGWVMINKSDGKFHRVVIGGKMYCKMGGK